MFFGLLGGIVLQLPNALALGELFLANMAIAGKPTMFFLKGDIYIYYISTQMVDVSHCYC